MCSISAASVSTKPQVAPKQPLGWQSHSLLCSSSAATGICNGSAGLTTLSTQKTPDAKAKTLSARRPGGVSRLEYQMVAQTNKNPNPTPGVGFGFFG
jgi:hypothetical protein